ncbi:ribonuclease Z, mitochondrial [Copidosoma floridanum]|uniref:ribonuclease Z, mitochondrial n=1 Tax=Copidosoma floridanum TaxID=29053 RepID=UPI0006C9BBC1|nr:ribonuclease Z, mitochondrial [Copidosoma floridanum]
MIFSKFGTFARVYRLVTTTTRASHQFRALDMPRDLKLRVQELQKQRQRLKAQSVKYAPTYAYLQVLGHGTRAESRSVFLCTDHCNYVFNCGEGTQRLAYEHHAKLTKIENIFITRPTWNNMGGLPGVALTIQETGVPEIYLHGPEDSIGVIEATENFMNLNELTVKPFDISRTFRDQTMMINYVLIQKPCEHTDSDEESSGSESDNINFYAYQTRKRPFSPTRKAAKKFLKKRSKTDDLLMFFCKLEKKLGTLNVEKCLELGVPSGPLMGKLKAGKDVILIDGTVVKSVDVVGESDEGPSFIVLECPDEEWMNLVIENSAFAKYQSCANRENVSCIVHFTPEKVLKNPKYKEWMYKFGSDTTHLIVNEENTGYSSEAIHRMQNQLHLIHPTIFPFLHSQPKSVNREFTLKNTFNIDEESFEKSLDSSQKFTEENKKDLDESFLSENLKVRRCKTLDVFQMRPEKGLTTEKNLLIHPRMYIQETMEIDGFLDSLADLQTEINAKTKALGDNLEEYPRILMLGTGSSIPNKSRNTSGILFQIDEETSMLMDCGESTVNQLVRFFGEAETDKVLKSIKAIYVSHLHADHHLGLIGLLEQRKIITDDPIYLIAPQQIMPYLRYYSSRFNKILDNFELISNRDILMDHPILSVAKSKALFEALNISKISTVFVTHCPFAYAVAVTLKDGRKICYSGDTMPCDKLQQLARDSFLLIHEATMEDALESEAITKRHSTISQAINMGVRAEVNFTLLTHFSQRYAKLPLLPDSEQSGNDYSHVGIAYDFMLISLSRLPLLPLFYKTLGVMFNEFREELYQKAIKRDFQKQRLEDVV